MGPRRNRQRKADPDLAVANVNTHGRASGHGASDPEGRGRRSVRNGRHNTVDQPSAASAASSGAVRALLATALKAVRQKKSPADSSAGDLIVRPRRGSEEPANREHAREDVLVADLIH